MPNTRRWLVEWYNKATLHGVKKLIPFQSTLDTPLIFIDIKSCYQSRLVPFNNRLTHKDTLPVTLRVIEQKPVRLISKLATGILN